MNTSTHGNLASFIDHTLLRADAAATDIEKLAQEAIRFGFATVCVLPYRVALAKALLESSKVGVCTVIGFPLGANRSEVKAMETVRACADGATQLDMVINIGAVKEADWTAVQADIVAVVKAARGRTVKVILETALLNDIEIVKACELAERAGAQFVKTSTGFSKNGASVQAVKLMRQTVGDRMGVKASGGIRDLGTLTAMIDAGANRIGTSSGVQILSDGDSYSQGNY